MEKGITNREKETDNVLRSLENELGEAILYRVTGRFLAETGLESTPLGTWGLLLLTPTRVIFRHFAQPHPLFGGKGEEVRWSVDRDRFDTCAAVLQPFWNKIFSGTPDHVTLSGPGVHLAVETADDQKALPQAWNRSRTNAG